MIKYFYFEDCYIDCKWITKNEKVLYDNQKTDQYGYSVKYIKIDKNNKINQYIVDVEKRKNKNGGNLDPDFQEIYDRLLIQERNLKLETL